MPVVLLMIWLIVQGGLWWHARNVALGGAQEGARAASAQTRADGAARATEFITRAGGLDIDTVAQTSDGDTVTITVTGRSPSLIPGMDLSVTESSTAPLKGWTTP
ncbi:pilus assembly protein [Phytoactinopolyspora halotolerans]|uniref:Pilus assembly protein n=2 Tax=Phytoactinopolyspora halotolerans TaxID=1981512 RepID=A0A6L9S838_9ACTN|nr:pilus assembly protein [Phytoactinopolyspora halotolerans]